MNFFESELRKLFEDEGIFENPTFVGRSCFGDIGENLRCRIEFVTQGFASNYSALRVSILNRQDGVVDRMDLGFSDILGIKPVPGNPNFRNGVSPHIWLSDGKASWYAYKPTDTDYSKIRKSTTEYLNVFRSPQERKPSIDALIHGASTHGVNFQPSKVQNKENPGHSR